MNIKAYAKINFVLNVLGQRPDGFHNVETVMQALDFFDVIKITAGRESKTAVFLDCEDKAVPAGEDNIAWKAAMLMHDTFRGDTNDGIYIDIMKRIPVAAGLAGGSADAAAVLAGLAKLWNIDPKDVYPVAAKLGSDVPFCFANHQGIYSALAAGTGTELTPLEPTECKVLLAPSADGLSTKAVYETLGSAVKKPFNTGAFRWNAPLKVKAASMGNHLADAALSLKPELSETLAALKGIDSPLYTGVSGSGPTCFSVYHKSVQFKEPEGMMLLETLK